MIRDLYELKDKWNVGVIDLWNNDHMNAATAEEKELYMNDPIHPTRAGYLTWWYPEMKKQLLDLPLVYQWPHYISHSVMLICMVPV